MMANNYWMPPSLRVPFVCMTCLVLQSQSWLATQRGTCAVRSSRLLQSTQRTAADTTVPTVLLKRTRQSKAFRNGNQLVFTRAIQSIQQDLDVGDLVRIAVEDKPRPTVLGWGLYNPHSLYKVRFLCHKYLQPQLHEEASRILSSVSDEEQRQEHCREAVHAMIRHHVQAASSLRRIGLNLPEANQTDTYRLINGEGDGLSGLAVDVIGGTIAVAMSSALWCQVHQDVIVQVLEEFLPDHTLVWKTTLARLEQDGMRKLPSYIAEHLLQTTDEDSSEHQRRVLARENGVVFATYPFADGQKTGVYCDQRENRWHIATLARNKRVLDLCCYHGGFSLSAVVRGNAAAADGVDSSADAIATCEVNAELNQCSDKVTWHRADIADFLSEQYLAGERFDIVVLDPPKLAPNAKALDKARRKYHGLDRDAIKVVNEKGGLLLTCTCSAAMTQKDGGQYFLNMVQGAALSAGRQVTLLSVSGAASCHTQSPISWPAGAYLTAALFYVHSV